MRPLVSCFLRGADPDIGQPCRDGLQVPVACWGRHDVPWTHCASKTKDVA